MPTVKIIRIPVNDAYTDAHFDKLTAGAQKAGIVNQSYGREVEDPSQLYWVIHFDQGFEQKDVVWPKAEYGGFKEGLSYISRESTTNALCDFKTFPKEVTKAPVTGIVIVTLKDGVKYAEVDAIIKSFAESICGKVPGLHGMTWANNSTNDREVYLVPGWDTIENHLKFKDSPEFQKYLTEVGPYVACSTKSVHVHFKDHQNI